MLRNIIIFLAICLISGLSNAQIAAVRLIVYTPPVQNKNVYVAGSFNQWSAGDSLYRMHRVNDTTYTIVLPVYRNTIYQYKYSLGNWGEEEVALNGNTIKNRSFVADRRRKKLTDVVQKWQIPKPTAASGNLQMARLTAMKDSVAQELKPKLNDMLVLLRAYIINLLQERPDEEVDKRITGEIVTHFTDVYGRVNGLCHKISSDFLTREQKQKILKAVKTPEGDKDIINTFLSALNAATMEGVKTQ